MRLTLQFDTSKLNIKTMKEHIYKVLKIRMVTFSINEIVIGSYNKLTSDNHVLTGRLRQSVHAKYNKKYMTNVASVQENYLSHKYIADISGESFTGRLKDKVGDMDILIGTDVPYAAKIEFLYDSYLFFSFESSKNKLKPALEDALKYALR